MFKQRNDQSDLRVFWEVNTGRAVDFLPWLIQAPLKFKRDIKQWTGNVRGYVLNNLIDNKADQTKQNLLNSLLEKVQSDINSQVRQV